MCVHPVNTVRTEDVEAPTSGARQKKKIKTQRLKKEGDQKKKKRGVCEGEDVRRPRRQSAHPYKLLSLFFLTWDSSRPKRHARQRNGRKRELERGCSGAVLSDAQQLPGSFTFFHHVETRRKSYCLFFFSFCVCDFLFYMPGTFNDCFHPLFLSLSHSPLPLFKQTEKSQRKAYYHHYYNCTSSICSYMWMYTVDRQTERQKGKKV